MELETLDTNFQVEENIKRSFAVETEPSPSLANSRVIVLSAAEQSSESETNPKHAQTQHQALEQRKVPELEKEQEQVQESTSPIIITNTSTEKDEKIPPPEQRELHVTPTVRNFAEDEHLVDALSSDGNEDLSDNDESNSEDNDDDSEGLAPLSPPRSQSGSTAHDYYHDKKAAFMNRLGRRKNSLNEGSSSRHDASDTSSINSTSLHISSLPTTPAHKLSKKRSSKLLGKLVPKFLQTSFSPALPSSNTSPKSQTASLSPVSTRSSHSGSTGGSSPGGKALMTIADDSSLKSSTSSSSIRNGSQESLARKSSLSLGQCSPGVNETTSPEFLECLRSELNNTPASSLPERRSSCSSGTSKRSMRSSMSKTASSTYSRDHSEAVMSEKNSHGCSAIGLDNNQGDTNAVEKEKTRSNNEKTTEVIPQGRDTLESNALALPTGFVESIDPPPSPYIIDDNCEDDFFLNSVLRRKSTSSNSSYTPSFTSAVPADAVMSCSYPSNATISTVNSAATTPSLSGWSSNSSQASTPSPTSPSLANGQVYPFPETKPNMAIKESPYQYRSNPLPEPIIPYVDEKRSRLRAAVGEWRRAASQSA
ncbi:hypothetical protein BGZ94_007979 [Podila epigama]|nr:hypothetical protein BGZ94_007979 [Podila epigama]